MQTGVKEDWDVVYICDWLPPDFGAVGQYSELFSREFALQGLRVVLIGISSSPNGRATDELIGPGFLHKVVLASARYDKTSTLKRLAWTAWTNTRLLIAAWNYIRRSKRVVFTGSPPLFLHWIAPANLLLRKTLIYRITDFHPECAIAERGHPSFFLKILYRVTLFWRRRVSSFEVLGHDQAARLACIGVTPDRIHLKRDPSPVAIGPHTRPLKRPELARGKVLLLYSGNWGTAHDYMTFVNAYKEHHRAGNGRVLLWLNATGIGSQRVEEALRQFQLPFVRGEPVALNQLASLLVTPDAHLITLSDAFVGFVLPSKVYGCVQSNKPVIFFGSELSDVHRICVESGIPNYRRVNIGDIEEATRALNGLGMLAD